MSAEQEPSFISTAPTGAPNVVEADDDAIDIDSALGDDAASSTASLRSSVLEYSKENGRRYHAFKAGKYVLPNDEEEMDRLDLQHHLFLLTFDKHLYLAPVDEETPLLNVLDVGTGTGIWAMDFADAHPQSTVIGIDLSPIQPDFGPPNLSYQIDDMEDEWTFSQNFDFIYARMMTGSIADWPKYFRRCYENLAPGGYLEVADIDIQIRSDDDSIPDSSALKRWGDLMREAAAKIGRRLVPAEDYVQELRALGFENVTHRQFKWPTCPWPKDKNFKTLGLWCNANLGGNLEGLSQAVFTRGLGRTIQELEVFLVDVRKDFKDPKLHAYFPINVVYARKPR